MANEDLGVKRDCPNCGARFYDLKKDPAHCPKCDHEFTPDVLLKSRKRLREEEQAASKPADQTVDEPEEAEEEVKEIDAEAENTTSLDDADGEATPAKSKRAKSLDDDDEDDDDEDEDDELANIDDIDLPDEEDDDTLLDDEDDNEDIAGIAAGKGDDD